MSQYEANPNTPQMPPQQGYAPQNQYPPQQPQQPKKGNGGKIALILLCLLMVVGIGLLMADQYDLFAAEEPHMQQGNNLPPADFQGNSNAGSEHSVHNWMDATCEMPMICVDCGMTKGTPLGHNWMDATCEMPMICVDCGMTKGTPLGHNWMDATCEMPMICVDCGMTRGTPLGHNWMDATYAAPKTCRICGKTEGSKLQVESVYINELEYYDKYGKVYYHDNQKAYYENNTDWRDLNTPGHLERPVMDGYGNVFTYGIHMDGDQRSPYYISYNLDGKYTTFSGWCVLPDFKVNSADANTYSKYFEIYCDGRRVFTSNTMRNGSTSQFFEIDITGVEILTIQYAPTAGPNDLAVLCDGFLK